MTSFVDEGFLGQMVKALSVRSDPIRFDEGLRDNEVERAQERWGFVFPPDLRRLLQFALPVSPRFVDWRHGQPAAIQQMLDWPSEGIRFDVEHNDFWDEKWGPRPADIKRAKSAAREHVIQAPRLIPIYSHRYLPAEPREEGNPVFSVYQTDIIYYGENLRDYIQREFWTSFERPEAGPDPDRIRPIRFWSDLVETGA